MYNCLFDAHVKCANFTFVSFIWSTNIFIFRLNCFLVIFFSFRLIAVWLLDCDRAAAQRGEVCAQLPRNLIDFNFWIRASIKKIEYWDQGGQVQMCGQVHPYTMHAKYILSHYVSKPIRSRFEGKKKLILDHLWPNAKLAWEISIAKCVCTEFIS